MKCGGYPDPVPLVINIEIMKNPINSFLFNCDGPRRWRNSDKNFISLAEWLLHRLNMELDLFGLLCTAVLLG